MTSYGMNAVLQPFVDDVKKLVSVLADILPPPPFPVTHKQNHNIACSTSSDFTPNVNHHLLLAINYCMADFLIRAYHLHSTT